MERVEIGDNGEIRRSGTDEVIGQKTMDGLLLKDESRKEVPVEKTPPMAAPLPRPKVSLPVPKTYSKYEVRPDTTFRVEFLLGFKDGLVQVYSPSAEGSVDGLERHWAVFRMWTYTEELKWKSKCMEPDPSTRTMVINQEKLNEMKLRNLIREWSFGEHDDRFRLLHVGGVLADESWEVFRGLFPGIVNNVIYLMNRYLEGNG